MTTYPTDMHGPSASARTVSNEYAICAVCKGQWQVITKPESTAGCPWCGAPVAAVSVHSEAPDYGGHEHVN